MMLQAEVMNTLCSKYGVLPGGLILLPAGISIHQMEHPERVAASPPFISEQSNIEAGTTPASHASLVFDTPILAVGPQPPPPAAKLPPLQAKPTLPSQRLPLLHSKSSRFSAGSSRSPPGAPRVPVRLSRSPPGMSRILARVSRSPRGAPRVSARVSRPHPRASRVGARSSSSVPYAELAHFCPFPPSPCSPPPLTPIHSLPT